MEYWDKKIQQCISVEEAIEKGYIESEEDLNIDYLMGALVNDVWYPVYEIHEQYQTANARMIIGHDSVVLIDLKTKQAIYHYTK